MKRWVLLAILAWASVLCAQDGVLHGRILVKRQTRKAATSADVIVWLTPLGTRPPVQAGPIARLEQKNKQFVPHVLAITSGTTVEFPNHDPFFHDVFSIYHGRPFDLGLYESGAARQVAFTRTGVSYIFCNIHPEMSAVIVVLQTPYFARSGADGQFQIANLPPGKYQMELWHELVSSSDLSAASREVEIAAGDNSTPTITLHSTETVSPHVNKYGESYSTDKTPY